MSSDARMTAFYLIILISVITHAFNVQAISAAIMDRHYLRHAPRYSTRTIIREALKKSREMPTGRNNLRPFVSMRPKRRTAQSSGRTVGSRSQRESLRHQEEKYRGSPSLYHPRDEASARSDRRNHRSSSW